jgi:ABC-2 type transport system ATP-binding protein
MQNGNSIAVENLVKRFGDFTAVGGVSFETRRGEIFGFLGPNGAGKSTTIRMLCGLLRPTSGVGRVAGFDISREAEKVRQNIGYMSQKFSLYHDLTVEENLRFYAGLYNVPRRLLGERLRWAIERSPARSPAAGSSGWRWAAPCCTARRFSFSTSRPPAWTPSRGGNSGT